MEAAQCRALVKKCKTGQKGWNTYPPTIHLPLMNAKPKRKPPLKVHDLSTLGNLECSLHVYIYRKDSTLYGKQYLS